MTRQCVGHRAWSIPARALMLQTAPSETVNALSWKRSGSDHHQAESRRPLAARVGLQGTLADNVRQHKPGMGRRRGLCDLLSGTARLIRDAALG